MRIRTLIGSLGIGRPFPVRVESMVRTPLDQPEECLREIHSLHEEGCELVRIAFPEIGLADNLLKVVSSSPVETMADIHFDHRLAIMAIKSGCRSIRINPGNMGCSRSLIELSRLINAAETIVRVGANAGSLSRSQMEKAEGDTSRALFETVSEQILTLQKLGVERIIMSAKSSSIPVTLKANTLLAGKFRYPVHVGLTESGPGQRGTIKSCVAISSLLGSGIGDTIRVSLTGPSVDEVIVGKRILQALEIRRFEPELISCPACGRRRVDVASLVERIEPLLKGLPAELTVAVMGCEVNGPQEASNADIGVAGTPSGIMLFARGKAIGACAAAVIESRFIEVCKEQGYLLKNQI
ncbi:MAG: (E)-4-hydroxy-3-methylbut-2-enyl-diphosphate synthase [Thermovirgaceae bacterium]|nr:(E)-4-hydroxy-3-methylbut-2-enyl-diphosphate synthase [Thermovirgaceae bacterium]